MSILSSQPNITLPSSRDPPEIATSTDALEKMPNHPSPLTHPPFRRHSTPDGVETGV
jgi:hypothetical protein